MSKKRTNDRRAVFSSVTVRRRLHKQNIDGRALIIDGNAKRRLYVRRSTIWWGKKSCDSKNTYLLIKWNDITFKKRVRITNLVIKYNDIMFFKEECDYLLIK